MNEFDIFKGTGDTDALCLEAAESLSGARARMEQMAAKSPGQYFVFDPRANRIVSRIDAREPLVSDQPKKAKSA